MLLGLSTAKYVLSCAPPLVPAKMADVLCCLLWVSFHFLSFLKFLSPELYGSHFWIPEIMTSHRSSEPTQTWLVSNGWYTIPELATFLPQMDSGNAWLTVTIDKASSQGRQAVLRTHPNFLQGRLPRTQKRGKECLEKELAKRGVGEKEREREKSQPSGAVSWDLKRLRMHSKEINFS